MIVITMRIRKTKMISDDDYDHDDDDDNDNDNDNENDNDDKREEISFSTLYCDLVNPFPHYSCHLDRDLFHHTRRYSLSRKGLFRRYRSKYSCFPRRFTFRASIHVTLLR